MRWLLRLLATLTVGAVAVAAAGVAVAPQVDRLGEAGVGQAEELVLAPLSQRSYIYSSDGTLIATLHGDENRQAIPLEEMPQTAIDAILAVEDSSFYEHNGVNLRATVRALLENVEAGGIAQGGSTITQQLVKQSLVGAEQSLDHKVREAVLAMRLEEEMTKDEILERYLNTVYFGNGAYGIEAAAEIYFGIPAEQLNIGQAALLAGVIRSPVAYNPFTRPEVAEERRRIALGRMVETGKITPADAAFYEEAPLPDEPVQFNPRPDDYFEAEVRRRLLQDPRLGETYEEREEAVFRGGLRIYTTMDRRAQYLAILARNEVIEPFAFAGNPALFVAGQVREEERGKVAADNVWMLPDSDYTMLGTAAVTSVEPSSGAVRVMVGGPGFADYPYNIVTGSGGSGRQAGSAFKLFVLLSLLEQGFSPEDLVSGVGPCRFDIDDPTGELYEVENYSNQRGGVADLRTQTLRSSNCAYIRLGQVAGMENVIDLAARMGVSTPLQPYFSTPLGAQEVYPIDMAAAYATIASRGIYHEPYLIERVETADGDVILEHEPSPRRVISARTAEIAADILLANVETGRGTGSAARLDDRDAGGKTGTAQDFSDAWFVGFTPQLATAVWFGSPGAKVSMYNVGGRRVTGGSYPARLWGRFMGAYHDGAPVVDFPEPEPVKDRPELLELDPEIDKSPRARLPRRSSDRRRSTGGVLGTSQERDEPTTTTTAPPRQRQSDGDGDDGDRDDGDGDD